MTNQKTFSTVRNVMFAIAAVCLFTRCQDDALETVSASAETEMATAGGTESNVGSLTIIGSNTDVVSGVDCKTCTYVVAKDAETIDGNALGLKPGSVICLDAAVKYGNLTFDNLEGTPENPIIIGTFTKTP